MIYKRSGIISFILLSLITIPYGLIAQKAKGFVISGYLEGLNDGDIVKLGNRFADWHRVTWTDSCKVSNGKFTLKVDEVPEGPRYYEIIFYKGVNGHSYGKTIDDDLPRQNAHSLDLIAENGDKIAVSGSRKEWKKIKISGSRSYEAYWWAMSLVNYADSCNVMIKRRLRKIKDSIGYEKKLVEEQVLAKESFTRYLDSATRKASAVNQLCIPILMITLHDYFGGYHGYFQKDLYGRLSPYVQNGFLGKQARNFANLSVGQPFPAFSLPTVEGNKIELNGLLAKNKITLVHFWGTNSVDREKYQNELKVMYSKFNGKGLDIIGISADTVKDDWEFMVHQKKYPWPNVIAEPMGWGEGSLINDVYCEGEHSIPNTTNVLLDQKGTILAWDVDGLELQYYLEKYLGL